MSRTEYTDTAPVHAAASRIAQTVSTAFRGKPETVDHILAAFFSGGHVLLEDVPGTGKTILARAIAKAVDLPFSRIQCTSDLMPADITGVSVFSPRTQKFRFRKGPLMSTIVLVDELNRATPRTQSALLEAMAEGQISADGRLFPLSDLFFVIATENPVEQEGTFPLPEAQKDCFLLSVSPGYPSADDERLILESHRRSGHPVDDIAPVTGADDLRLCKRLVTEVHVDPAVRDYMLALSTATRNDPRIALGASPRGTLALYRVSQALAAIRGRSWVVPEDVKELLVPCFLKRILLSTEYLARGYKVADLVAEIAETIPVPVSRDV